MRGDARREGSQGRLRGPRAIAGRALWLLGVLAACQAPKPRGTAHPSSPTAGSAPLQEARTDPAPRAEITRSSDDIASLLTPGWSYRFAAAPCRAPDAEASCPFTLELRHGQQVATTLTLDPTFPGEAAPLLPSRASGLGDPLGQPTRWKAWKIGKDEAFETLGATLVRLGPQREAILTRRVRFETAHHTLAVRRDGLLREVPIAGRWSSIEVRSTDQRADRIDLFVQSVGQPGFVWASSPSWNDESDTLEAGAPPAPEIQMVALGPYPTWEAAQELASGTSSAAHAPCLPGGVVTPTDLYEGLSPGQFVYAALTADTNAAAAALASAKSCARSSLASVRPLRFRWRAVAELALESRKHAQIGLGPYDGVGWPLSVALGDAAPTGGGANRLALPWPASTPLLAKPSADAVLPAGDPARPWTVHDKGVAAWTMGDTQAPSLVAAKTVRLGAGRTGLLIAMEAGFEHLKRWHGVIIADGDRPKIAWSAADPQGPAWSTIVVRARADGTEELIYLAIFEASQEDQQGPDRLQASRLTWKGRDAQPALEDLACKDALSLVVTRTFPTVEAAIAAKAEPCPLGDGSARLGPAGQHPLVLAAPPGSASQGYVLAYATTDRGAARRLAIEAARCWPKARKELLPWCPKERAQKGE